MSKSKSSHNSKKAVNHPMVSLSEVRIIGGQYRRRLVKFIETKGLRPTPDRVRETLFNWLDFELPNARVLDCCAGSGVLGFEALSRGASQVTMIEPNREQFRQLQLSQAMLGIAEHSLQLVNDTAQHALTTFMPVTPFDVVFLDPPYNLSLWDELLCLLIHQQLINASSLIYIEANQPIASVLTQHFSHLHCLKDKKMGQVHLGLYQLNSP